jgi:SAM-dependent methyltransferase
MFAYQPNSPTREFEYPWAWYAVPVVRGATVVDLGGSLAGFQFALSRAGCRVINVDPGESATGRGWPVDCESMARLNRAFGTDVALVNATLQAAKLRESSVDVVYPISTIEHIPDVELPDTMREVARILKPGGSCVLTVDLFLNLEPFTDRTANRYGTNVSVKSLVDASGLLLVLGKTDELYGYPDFDHRRVLASLYDKLVGEYPVLAQCLVLTKHESEFDGPASG